QIPSGGCFWIRFFSLLYADCDALKPERFAVANEVTELKVNIDDLVVNVQDLSSLDAQIRISRHQRHIHFVSRDIMPVDAGGRIDSLAIVVRRLTCLRVAV